MQFSKTIALSFMLAFASAAPAAVADAAPAPVFDAEADAGLFELDNQLAKRGFGCPFHAQECNDHCITLKGGRTGGYCKGLIRQTCVCVKG